MPFPMMLAPGQLGTIDPISETIWPEADAVVSVWEDEGGATTDLWQSVDSESDLDWVELRDANHIVTSGTRALRFDMETPSADPSPYQTVEIQVRCRWVDVFGAANPDAGDPNLTIGLYESGTNRGTDPSPGTITTSAADYSFFPTAAQIASVTDWAEVEVNMSFECSGIDIDEEVDIEVFEVRIIFS